MPEISGDGDDVNEPPCPPTFCAEGRAGSAGWANQSPPHREMRLTMVAGTLTQKIIYVMNTQCRA